MIESITSRGGTKIEKENPKTIIQGIRQFKARMPQDSRRAPKERETCIKYVVNSRRAPKKRERALQIKQLQTTTKCK